MERRSLLLVGRLAAPGLDAEAFQRPLPYRQRVGIELVARARLFGSQQAVGHIGHRPRLAGARPTEQGPGLGSLRLRRRPPRLLVFKRSEERRVGKAFVSTGRSRWSPYH